MTDVNVFFKAGLSTKDLKTKTVSFYTLKMKISSHISVEKIESLMKEALPRIIDDICSKALNSPWAKLYRREIIEREGIRFPLSGSLPAGV